MIPKEVYNYDEAQLVNWLRFEAGSSNPDYFHARKTGGMKLQQVPEEYALLLLLLKQSKIENYLSLGVGNGGSFAMECFFMQETLNHAIEVDNLAYGELIKQNEPEILSFIENVRPHVSEYCHLQLIKDTTDGYFVGSPELMKFDAIFIDADHSYEGAKRDYNNALNHINKGGLIIFHDINSAACPGIKMLWSEVKQGRTNWEFVYSQTCGIGVIKL